MLRTAAVYGSALACIALFSGPTPAAEPAGSNMKLSQAECETLWNQANPTKGSTLSQSQAQTYVTNFKSVDTDSDGSISQTEFMTGCNNGNVKGSASSGTSSGASGTSSSGTNPSGASQ